MKRFFFLIFLASCSLTGFAKEKKKTVCLNMIIKDESKVIERCLESVKPMIDYWVIVDTGSTDGTQKIVKNCMKGIPGKLHERPWVNFEHNRNEALEYARGKGDYLLWIDADEQLVYEEGFALPDLEKDIYFITTEFGGMTYVRSQLINNHLNWRWEGVVHEVLMCPEAQTRETLAKVVNCVRAEGARSQDPFKYHKDAALLEEAMKEDPYNARNQFYLAQSYRDAGELEKALENYQKRVDLGGWAEEVFWSKYQIALLMERLDYPSQDLIKAYTEAYVYRPHRVEPLYHLANHLRLNEDYFLAYLVASHAMDLPYPAQDVLFIEDWMHHYGLQIEKSVSAYWIGKFDECYYISEALASNPDLPQHIIECAERNRDFAQERLEFFNPDWNATVYRDKQPVQN